MSTPLMHPGFDPVAIALGPIQLHWYGLMYLAAFAAFFLLGRRAIRLDRQGLGMRPIDLDDLLFWGVLGVILGGRLGYVLFYKPLHYLAHPLEILAVWEGGMSFHGGLLGVILAMFFLALRRPHLGAPIPTNLEDQPPASGRPLLQRFLMVGDFVAPLVPIGLAFGRLGNFINGELWGRLADADSWPWAMVFPGSGSDLPRHPSQLYQMALEGLLLFVVLQFLARRPRPTGLISGVFLLGYGLARFLVEFAREPDAFLGLLAIGLTMGQWLSLPMMGLGLILILASRRP